MGPQWASMGFFDAPTIKTPFEPADANDERVANRLAEAMVHAAELCGGGSQFKSF